MCFFVVNRCPERFEHLSSVLHYRRQIGASILRTSPRATEHAEEPNARTGEYLNSVYCVVRKRRVPLGQERNRYLVRVDGPATLGGYTC